MRSAALLCLLLIAPSPVSAQGAADPAVLIVDLSDGPAPPDRREAFLSSLQAEAGERRVEDPAAWVVSREDVSLVPRDGVMALGRVEELLGQARALAAALHEAQALRLLVEAAGLAEDQAYVPGAASFIAEVYTAMGITAAQAGQQELSEGALTRAALITARGVRAADAPPAVVHLAGQVARSVASRPTGSFVVSTDAPGARVLLDDALVGSVPATVRAVVGRHVLRVEAPGYAPFGGLIDVLEGQRAPVEVVLSPRPALLAARRVVGLARAMDLEALTATLAVLRDAGDPLQVMLLLQVGAGDRDRALLAFCDDAGCRGPLRLEGDGLPPPEQAPPMAHPLDALASARVWLAEPIARPPPVPWWRRWYVWAAIGAAAAGAVAGGVVALRPAPERRWVVEVSSPGLVE